MVFFVVYSQKIYNRAQGARPKIGGDYDENCYHRLFQLFDYYGGVIVSINYYGGVSFITRFPTLKITHNSQSIDPHKIHRHLLNFTRCGKRPLIKNRLKIGEKFDFYCILPHGVIVNHLKIGGKVTTKIKLIREIPQRKSELRLEGYIAPSKLQNLRLFSVSTSFIYKNIIFSYFIIFYLLFSITSNNRA